MEFLIVLFYVAIIALVFYPVYKIGIRLGFSGFASFMSAAAFLFPITNVIMLYYYAYGRTSQRGVGE